MNGILNQTLTTENGRACRVKTLLGSGGQGEVYQVEVEGRDYALKWYYPENATPQQYAALQELVQIGPPTNRFLWPLELVRDESSGTFGYLMPLREARFKSLNDLMKRRAEPTFKSLCKAGFQLADSYLQLHAKGLCYRDISFGNVFFDPSSGEALICDNDNVGITGQSPSGVLGTPRFMAPEVVRGEAEPSTDTDLYSLAVLLFYMFMLHHPLEGRREYEIKCFDLPAMRKLYGDEPLFIFDPQDDSNQPVPHYQQNPIIYWPIYPQFLRDLFTRAFTDGIRDPKNGRVRESEWRMAFVQLGDSIMYCPACGAENFYDSERIKNAKPIVCWNCNRSVPLPMRLRLDGNAIMLNHDTKIYPHHLGTLYDFSKPVAEVAQNPNNPAQWGLRNLSEKLWTATFLDGRMVEVQPGKAVSLNDQMKVNFGEKEGEIRLGG